MGEMGKGKERERDRARAIALTKREGEIVAIRGKPRVLFHVLGLSRGSGTILLPRIRS